MRFSRFALTALLASVFGCTTVPHSSSPPPMGLLKVTITGLAEGVTPDAKAEWVAIRPHSQAVTVYPINGMGIAGDVQLSRRAVSFLDTESTNERFVQSTFDLVNWRNTAFDNLTFYAVNVPGITLGGSGIASVQDALGNAITSEAQYRAFVPTHAMGSTVRSVEVNASVANLQFFSPTEVNSPEPSSLGVQQQAITLGILPSTATVLEYGFVANGRAGGRSLQAANNYPNGCTLDACKGAITLAYRFPKISPRKANPFTFSLYFVVANQSNHHTAQSVEEQVAGTVAGISNMVVDPNNQFQLLYGTSFTAAYPYQNYLCAVRTATSTSASPGHVYLSGSIPAGAGSLDLCLNRSGYLTTRVVGSSPTFVNDTATAIAVQPDEKVVLAGTVSDVAGSKFAVVRYHRNGGLDSSFDSDGQLTTTLAGKATLNDVALQPDGKIVAAGSVDIDPSSNSSTNLALVRYGPFGVLDNGFGTGGMVMDDLGTTFDRANTLAIQPDGKIVVAGDRNGQGALLRYNPDGTPDTDFGSSGRVFMFSSLLSSAVAVALQSDGKIVVAGTSFGSDFDFGVARFNPNGTLDPTFGSAGKASITIGTDFIRAMALQSDGKIVVGGESQVGTIYVVSLARFNPNGSVDTSFDGDGKLTTVVGNAGEDRIDDLRIQPDGKIVAVGSALNTSNRSAVAIRYNPNGSLDSSFGNGGKVMTSISSNPTPLDIAGAVALQSDGKLVVAGSSSTTIGSDFALFRYNP